jgi:hypothetical protein
MINVNHLPLLKFSGYAAACVRGLLQADSIWLWTRKEREFQLQLKNKLNMSIQFNFLFVFNTEFIVLIFSVKRLHI